MHAIVQSRQIDPQERILFDPDKILVAATDNRGVIRYANPHFCEISQYRLSEMVGAPHKILRHPDMPRGIYHIFWSRLKQNLPVCAYIRNRAADGRYYQVLALIIAIPDGYLSIRIHPRSSLQDETYEAYKSIMEEEAKGLPPERSAEMLEQALSKLGYPTIDRYMQALLHAELAQRTDVKDIAGNPLVSIDDLADMIARAEGLVAKISDIFGKVRGEPVNLRILASRMEVAGAAISTISKNYETMTSDMYRLVQRLNDSDSGLLTRIRHAIDQGRFAAQVSVLMQLAKRQSIQQHDTVDFKQENVPLLTEQAVRLEEISRVALKEIGTISKCLPDTSRQLRRRINGLDLVKLLCRVESGRIGDSDSGLDGIIQRLEHAHHSTDLHLSELSALSARINSRSLRLNEPRFS